MVDFEEKRYALKSQYLVQQEGNAKLFTTDGIEKYLVGLLGQVNTISIS